MNKIKWGIIASVLITLLFSSCLSSSNDETVVGDECAITSMVIGTLNRTVTTKKSTGEDTSYVTTLSGSVYPMYIDQINREIYNPDSLPLGTDVKKVVFSSISADGSVAYRKDSGADTIYSSTDSLDFTSPRLFTCYAYSGEQKLTYKVHVNVHQVNPEAFVWNKVGVFNQLSEATEVKAFCKDSTIFVFAQTNSGTFLMKVSENGTEIAEREAITGSVPAKLHDIQMFNGKFYGISNHEPVVSEDGKSWSQLSGANVSLSAMVCVSEALIFATDNTGLYHSTDCISWVKDTLDSSSDYLPQENYASSYTPMSFNKNFQYVFFSGNDASGNSVLWKKVIDKENKNDDVWSYYPSSEEIRYPLPKLPSAAMISYDDKTIYLGCKNDTVSSFYVTQDAGRTWIPDTVTYIHPYKMAATAVGCTVDDRNFIWLICAGSGQIWCGRLNRLSFNKNQTSFTE